MFLVLIEYVEDEGTEWSVVAHGRLASHALRSTFPTREEAEKVAMEKAKTTTNRFAVVEIKSWYRQEVHKTVQETRIG